MQKDNNRNERWAISGIIELEVHNKHMLDVVSENPDLVVGSINDISRSGIGGHSFNLLTEGEHIVVKRIRSINKDIKCDIPATVVWSKIIDNSQRFGIYLEKDIPGPVSDIEFSD